MCAVADGKVLALVPLPIAGIMNDLPAEEMADLISKLDAAWKEMGCVINSPYMTMALIPLACLPELRLTNRGLVDCRTFSFAELFAGQQPEAQRTESRGCRRAAFYVNDIMMSLTHGRL